MREFIAEKIKEAAQIVDGKPTNIAAGQAKYRAYFINTKLWAKYKEDVDAILTVDGCADCIVTA